VHDSDLEGIAVQAEVPFNPAYKPFHPGVRANGAAPASGSVSARQPSVEPLLIRPPNESLERAPVRALDLLE